MKKEILFIVATHGDEKIGLEAVERLKKRGLGKYFDYLIANPKALALNKRFVDFDLNRAYPGKKHSRFYEKRRAYDNLKLAKKYRYVVDIHEASAGTEDFIIIPREKTSPIFPLEFINFKKVLLWPNPKGPLSQVLGRAIELEFGVKNRKRKVVVAKAVNILVRFLRLVSRRGKPLSIAKKQSYYVYGKLLVGEVSKQEKLNLADFKLARIKNEFFYPLLVGQYKGEGIMCYKMKLRLRD